MRFTPLPGLCLFFRNALSKWWTYSSISPHPDSFSRPQEANPLKLLESVFFFFLLSEIAFQFTCRLQQPFRWHTCCLSLDFAFWSEGRLTKEAEEGAEEEGEARRKDPYRMLSTGQWIFSTIQMYLQNAWVIHYSRFWSVTMDLRNEWWYLFADFISLILLIPLACVPLLIRK